MENNKDITILRKDLLKAFKDHNEELWQARKNYSVQDYSNFIQNKMMHTLKIPRCYHYSPWCKLYNDLILLDTHVIPIALITDRYCSPEEDIEDFESLARLDMNKFTMADVVLTNPYHNMRIAPGDRMIIIGEIYVNFDNRCDVNLGDDERLLKDFNNEFPTVDRKREDREACVDIADRRLNHEDKLPFDKQIDKRAGKVAKMKLVVSKLRKLGRQQRRYNKCFASSLVQVMLPTNQGSKKNLKKIELTSRI